MCGMFVRRYYFSPLLFCELCWTSYIHVYKVKSPGSWVGCHAVSRQQAVLLTGAAIGSWRFHLHGVISTVHFSGSQVTFPTTSGVGYVESFPIGKTGKKKLKNLSIFFPNFFLLMNYCLLEELTCKVAWICVITLLCKMMTMLGSETFLNRNWGRIRSWSAVCCFSVVAGMGTLLVRQPCFLGTYRLHCVITNLIVHTLTVTEAK